MTTPLRSTAPIAVIGSDQLARASRFAKRLRQRATCPPQMQAWEAAMIFTVHERTLFAVGGGPTRLGVTRLGSARALRRPLVMPYATLDAALAAGGEEIGVFADALAVGAQRFVADTDLQAVTMIADACAHLDMQPESFPRYAGSGAEAMGWWPAEPLRRALTLLPVFCTADDSRPMLQCVHIEHAADRVRLAATDSYRLLACEASIERFDAPPPPLVLEARVLRALPLGGSGGDDLRLLTSGAPTVARLSAGPFTVIASTQSHTPPNYWQLIPTESAHQLTVDADRLYSALRELRPQMGRAPRCLRLTPRPPTALQVEAACACQTLPVDCHGAPNTSLGLNADFLRDAVRCFAGHTIRIGWTAADRPVHLHAVDDDPLHCQVVVMPVRL